MRFTEGEHCEHLYVVLRGRLKVLVRSPHGDALLLAVVRPGESVGELSILDGRPRSATAEALDEVEFLAVPAAVVREVLEASPAPAVAWAQDVALTVRRLTGSAADGDSIRDLTAEFPAGRELNGAGTGAGGLEATVCT